MKQLSFIPLLLLLAVAAGVVSCTHGAEAETEFIREEENTDQEYITLRMGFEDDAVTYATVKAEKTEKRLFSLAVFIRTAAGQFYKFVSHGLGQDSPFPFENIVFGVTYEDGTTSASSVRSVEIRLPGGFEGSAEVAVIGNYVSNGMSDRILALDNMDDVLALRHELTAAQRPVLRLLASYYDTWTLKPGEDLDETIVMKRVAARVVLPFQFKIGATTLTKTKLDNLIKAKKAEVSMLVYNGKSASYIFEEGRTIEQIDAIGQMERYDPITYQGAANQFVAGVSSIMFYTYEMTGNDAEKMTAYLLLRIRETTTSPWVEQLFPVELADKTDNTRPGTFVRNHAYIIDTGEIYQAETDGWDEGPWLSN